jgi:hypothetical protein
MSDWYHANLSARMRYEGLSQHAAEKHARMMRAQRKGGRLYARVRSLSDATATALESHSLSRRSARAIKTYWWVPAGIAALILVRSIFGG